MALTAGTKLGAYEIVALIGAGGMGEVYRARDIRLQRDVAVKVLPAALAQDSERLHRFELEARAAAALSHPHILSVHDVGTHEGSPFIVSELLEGVTLRERLASGPLPVRKTVELAIQLAHALAAAHERGIVHRDLKPENIFLNTDGRVKILDFGVAKLTERESPLASATQAPTTPAQHITASGVVLGTLGYMAPEQVRGQAVDHRADIFALGAVLYEMLSGSRAFRGDTAIDTASAVLKEDPPDLPTTRQIPPALVRIVDRCLEKNPAARFQSTRDLAFALEGLTAQSEPIAAAASATRRRMSSRLARAIGTALFLAMAIGAGALYVATRSVERETIRATIVPPANWSITVGNPPSRLALSPDGTRIAFVAVDAEQRQRLWVRRLDSLSSQQLDGTDNALWPFWSPDSRMIGFYADGKLKTIDASGGSVATICDVPLGPGGGGGGATWGEDGVILLNIPATGLYRVSASGGTPTPLGHQRGPATGAPFFLPGGRHFLYRNAIPSTRIGAAIMVGTLETGEQRELVRDVSNAVYAQGHLLFLRGTTLVAQPFDPNRLELSGEPRPIAENVLVGPGGNGAFSVSTNGMLAYLEGGEEGVSRLVWVDRSGKQLATVADAELFSDISLSNDGRRAAVTIGGSDTDIWLIDPDRGGRARFTNDAGREFTSLWSPNDERLIFNSVRANEMHLLVRPLAGTIGSEQSMWKGTTAGTLATSWSSDGRYVMVATGGDISYFAIDGEKTLIPFMRTPFIENGGMFSPDGRWVAYRSNESGRSEVWIAPFPGPGERIQVSTSGIGGGYPRWRRDGKELFFVDASGGLSIVAVDLRGARPSLGPVMPILKTGVKQGPRFAFDVSPDGQRLLVNTLISEPAGPSVTLVVNWPGALTRN